jgi:hypothetical protein
MRVFLFICALAFSTSPSAAEDFRVMKLEQDVRTLEREVQTLERLVRELQQRTTRNVPSFEIEATQPPAAETEQKWLQSSAWNRVKLGMTELDVIGILGKPTALRPDPSERRALLYTLEIGTTSFLTGSVAFENGKAVDIQRPTLR